MAVRFHLLLHAGPGPGALGPGGGDLPSLGEVCLCRGLHLLLLHLHLPRKLQVSQMTLAAQSAPLNSKVKQQNPGNQTNLCVAFCSLCL